MSLPRTAARAGYRPRSAHNALSDLAQDDYEELLSVYDERYAATHGPLHPRTRKLFEEFVRCGDPHFGFLRLRCTNSECPQRGERIVPFSCKTRGLCPSCGKKRALLWAERMVADVLPDVPYAQLVFTIPKILRKAFLYDRSLYAELARSAYAATRIFFEAQFPSLERPVPAFLATAQSWGSLLNFHPHLHALSSLGVFDRAGTFHPAPQDLDFGPLNELFREELFRRLRKKDALSEERSELIRSWRHSGFHLHTERRIAQGERRDLETLLEYMARPPLSLERLEIQDDRRVLYHGKYHPGLCTDHRLLSPLDFLALLVPHLALRYECRIHSYGALSTTLRRTFGWISSQRDDLNHSHPPDVVLAEEDGEFVRLRRRSWARLIRKVWLEDPSLCAGCGEVMKIVSALTSPHQDEAIEKILRHLGRWDPPQKRAPSARDPPPEASPREVAEPAAPLWEEDVSQLRPDLDEEFDQDPFPPSDPFAR